MAQMELTHLFMVGLVLVLEEAVEPEGIAPHPQTSQCSIMPIT